MPISNDDIIFKASLDIRDVQKALDRIEKKVDEVGNSGDKSFKKLGGSITKSVAAGNLLVKAFTSALAIAKKLASAAYGWGKKFVSSSVLVSSKIDVIKTGLTQLFEGNADAADALLARVLKLSGRLKVPYTDLAELVQGVLPDIGDIDTTFKLAEAAVQMGRQTGKSIVEIRRAIEEAAVGQFRSAKQILNIRPEDVRSINELAKSIGFAAASAEILTKRVKDTAIGIDIIEGKLPAAWGDTKTAMQKFQLAFGDIITPELTAKLNEFLSIFGDNEEDILSVADALGKMSKEILDLLGSELLNVFGIINFDSLAEGIKKLNDKIIDFNTDLQLTKDGFESIPEPGLFKSIFSPLKPGLFESAVNWYNKVLPKETRQQWKAFTNLQSKTAKLLHNSNAIGLDYSELDLTQKAWVDVSDAIDGVHRSLYTFNEDKINKAGDELVAALNAPGAEKLLAFYQKQTGYIEAATEAKKENHAETEKEAEGDSRLANIILKLKLAREAEANVAADAAEANISMLEERSALEDAIRKKIIDNAIRTGRDRIDAEIKFAQAREDIAEKNLEKIQDLERKNKQDIEDILFDETQKEKDIAETAIEDKMKRELDKAQKSLDIERDYRRRLEDIQRAFDIDATEAEVRQDIVGILRAKRNRENAIKDAQVDRDRANEDATTSYEQASEDQKLSQEQELSKLKETTQERLDELQRRYDRELETQTIRNQRAYDQQAIDEQRKRDALKRENIRRITDISKDATDRQAIMEKGFSDEYDILAKWEEAKTNLIAMELQKRKLLLYSYFGGDSGGVGDDSGGVGGANLGGMSPMQQSVILGGYQNAPITSYFAPPRQTALSSGGMFNNSQSNSFHVSETSYNDPVLRQMIINAVASANSGIFGGV